MSVLDSLVAAFSAGYSVDEFGLALHCLLKMANNSATERGSEKSDKAGVDMKKNNLTKNKATHWQVTAGCTSFCSLL